MRLIIKPEQIDSSPEQFILRAGYGHIVDRRRNVESYVQRLSGGFYPRLHMYINNMPDGRIAFDLHLDQKEASYAGSHMHNADYEGPVVETEIARLRALVRPATPGNGQQIADNRQPAAGSGQQAIAQVEAAASNGENDILAKIRPADYDESDLDDLPKRRSFWQRLFE
jgi:hypothetical protein